MLKKAIYILLGTACLTACSDSLDLYPKDSLSDKTFWNTKSDLEAYTNSMYSSIGASCVFDSWDNLIPNVRNTSVWGEGIVPASGGGWSWGDVRACNYLLTRHHTVHEEHSQYVGEARFFRAMFYFSKLCKFGEVPFYNKDLKIDDVDDLYKPRDSRDLVVDSILADLDYAIKTLPEKKDAVKGRLNKDAAATLASRVSLFEGTWRKYRNQDNWEKYLNKCVAYSEYIMNKGLYSIWTGMNDPKKNYYWFFIQEDMSNNCEVILPKIYDLALNLKHGMTRTLAQNESGYSADYVESYLCLDGKPISISPLYEGRDSIRQEMKNRDPRMMQTIDNPDQAFTTADDDTHPIYNSLPLPRCVTGYQNVKFHSPYMRDFDALNSTIDYPIYRYAEVLLNFAEAKAELGTLTNADLDKSINQIRKRVDMPNMTLENVNFEDPGAYDCGYPVSNLIREIRRERRVELVLEGFRVNDIKRWKAGKLLENPKVFLGMKVNPEMRARYETAYGGSGTYTRKTTPAPDYSLILYEDVAPFEWYDRLYLSPLPKDQLILNPNLTQNPGWENR